MSTSALKHTLFTYLECSYVVLYSSRNLHDNPLYSRTIAMTSYVTRFDIGGLGPDLVRAKTPPLDRVLGNGRVGGARDRMETALSSKSLSGEHTIPHESYRRKGERPLE